MSDLSLATTGVLNVVGVPQRQLTLISGATITIGQVMTINASTGKWAVADANGGDLDQPLYIALSGGVSGNPITGIRQGVLEGYDLSGVNYGVDLFLSTTAGAIATAVASVNEVQTLTVGGTPTGGTFKVTFSGEETASIAYNASAATVQSALEALASIGSGNVVVTGDAGGPWTATFRYGLGGQDLPIMTLSTNALTGGTDPTVVIAVSTTGVSQIKVGHVIPLINSVIGSTYGKALYVDL